MNEPPPLFNRKAIKPIECLSEGWELIKGNYWLFMGIAVVGYLIASLAPFAILLGPMMCGIYYCLLRQQRRKSIKFEMLFRGFDYFLQSFIATLIMVIPLVVIIVPAYIGFLVLVVSTTSGPGGKPGSAAPWAILGGMGAFYLFIFLVSIAVQVLFFFIYPLIADRKLTGVEAVRTSFRAASSNLGGVTGLVLITMLLEVVGSFCCVGTFFVLPIHFAAVAVAYRKVFPDFGSEPPPPLDGLEADYGPIPGTDEG